MCSDTWSCLTHCDHKNCSPPGFSVHGSLQASILRWVAMPSSRGSSHPGMEPGPPAFQRDSYQLSHQGSPVWHCLSYLKCSFFLSFYVQLSIMYHQFSNIPSVAFTNQAPLFGLPSAPCEVRPGTSNPGVRVLGNKGPEASDCKLRLQKASSRLLP